MDNNPDQSSAPTLYSSYPFPTYSAVDLLAMTETSFAKTFLAALDRLPVKLSAEHVEDARSYPARNAYILPRMPRPMSKPTGTRTAPGSERSLAVHIKSLRNPPLDIKLSSQPLNTSVLDIKTAVSEQSSIPASKIRMLHNKKPVVDSKVLKDLVTAESETTVEFSVMIMGGAAAVQKSPEAASGADVAQGASGQEVIQSAEFWTDLKGFLLQRIRDEKEAEELFGTFEAAWKGRS